MSGLLIALAILPLQQPPESSHRVSLGVEALHWSALDGAHRDVGSIDDEPVFAPGLAFGYAYALTDWFELGLDLGWTRFELDTGSLHAMRYALSGRFVWSLLDNRLGLSLVLGGGGALHFRDLLVSPGVAAFAGLGIRGALTRHFALYLDLRSGLIHAPGDGTYTQNEVSRLELLVGWTWLL